MNHLTEPAHRYSSGENPNITIADINDSRNRRICRECSERKMRPIFRYY